MPKKPTTQEQQLAATIELFSEALRDAEAALAVDDQGWTRVLGSQTDLNVKVLTQKAEQVELAATFNPLIKRGLSLGEAYVWGSGVQISVRDEASDGQDVNAVVQAFLDDPKAALLAGLEGQLRMERRLGTCGEVWLALPTDMRSGKVAVRMIPASQVQRVVCDPEDEEARQFVYREWTANRKQFKRLYPILGYRPARRDPQYDGASDELLKGVDVEWDTPVRPILVNQLGNRGIGYGTAALPWATAYKTFIEAWHRLMLALAKFAWRAKSARADKAQQIAQQVMQAAAGSSAVMDPNTQLEAISKSGATFDAGSGRPIAALVAAALDVPVTMLLSDPGVTGARAVAETLDQPTELVFNLRRRKWTAVITDVCDWVIEVAVESGLLQGTMRRDGDRTWADLPDGDERTIAVDWPPFDSTPVETLVKAIREAQDTQTVPPLVILRLLLKALEVEDADEILDQVTTESGDFIPLDIAEDRVRRELEVTPDEADGEQEPSDAADAETDASNA